MKSVKHLLSSLLLASSLTLSSVAIADENTKNQPVQQEMQSSPTNATKAEMADKLNINTANATEIQKSLIGIGAKKAEAIVQYREKHGTFTAPEQLLEVQGIGKATLEKNKDRIAF